MKKGIVYFICSFSLLAVFSLIPALGLFSEGYTMAQGNSGTAPYRGPRPSGVSPIKSDNNPAQNPSPIPVDDQPDTAVQNDGVAIDVMDSTDEKNYRAGESVTLGADEVINRDFFAAGKKVVLLGTVNGDVYIAGREVTIAGTVNGDILVAGGTVTVDGNVSNDIRAIGGNVTINADVAGSVTLVGGELSVTNNATVGKNLVIAGGDGLIGGPVSGSLNAFVNSIKIHNTISGDADIAAKDIFLLSTVTPSNAEPTVGSGAEKAKEVSTEETQALIQGNLLYYSDDEFQGSRALVAGTVTQKAFPFKEAEKESSRQSHDTGINFFSFIWLISTLILGLIFVYIAPNFMKAVSHNIRQNSLRSMGMGFIFMIIIPFAALFMIITIIGIPLGILTLIMYGVAMYFTHFFVMFAIGQFAVEKLNKNWSLWITFIIGMILFKVLTFIPVLGLLFSMLATITGFGAFIQTKKNFWKAMRSQNLI